MTNAPIVFLHGFLGAPAMWRNIERALKSPIDTYALDLPGHGAIPWLPSEPADFMSAVDALADRFPIADPAVLVGYSMGARLALALTLRHPARVRSAILIGVDPGIEDEAARTERVAWDDTWAERAASESLDAFASAWEDLPIFATQKSLPTPAKNELRRQRTSHTSGGISWAMGALGLGRMPSLWAEIPSASVPITLVTGALDVKFSEKSQAISDRAKNVRRMIIEGAGHNVALEAPTAVVDEIERRRAE